jgi:hypothetical protein
MRVTMTEVATSASLGANGKIEDGRDVRGVPR